MSKAATSASPQAQKQQLPQTGIASPPELSATTPSSSSSRSSRSGSGSSSSSSSGSVSRGTPQAAASKRSALKHAAGVSTCRGVASGVDALYTLFDIACSANSRLVFVGMANAINMISQALPRLASSGLQYEKVLFAPYSQAQVQRIVTARLADAQVALTEPDATAPPPAKAAATTTTPAAAPSAPSQGILAPPALGLLSKKVAARSGDMRLMLQLVRAAAAAAAKRLGAPAPSSPPPQASNGGDDDSSGPSQASTASQEGEDEVDPAPLSQGSCDSVHAPQTSLGGRRGGVKRGRSSVDASLTVHDAAVTKALLAKGPLISMKDALDAVKAVLTSPYVPALKALPTNCQVVVALAVGCARARARSSAVAPTTKIDLWANKGWDMKPTAASAASTATVRVAGATVSVGELSTAFNRVARKKLLDVHAVAAADFGDLVSRAVESGMLAVVSKGPGRGAAAGGTCAEWGLGLGVGVLLRVNIGEDEVAEALEETPLATVLQSELLGMGVLKGLLKAR